MALWAGTKEKAGNNIHPTQLILDGFLAPKILWQVIGTTNNCPVQRHRKSAGAGDRRSFGVRRLVAALPFPHGMFANRRGNTANIPSPFQVKPAETANVVPKAKSPGG